MLPDIGRLRAAAGRFRGLRLIHTHVHGEPLTRDDLVDLVRLRLDLVAALQLTPAGEPKTIHWACNVPTYPDDPQALPYRLHPPIAPALFEVDVGRLMADLEAEFARRSSGREVRAKDGRAILVHVGAPDRSQGDAKQAKMNAAAEGAASMRELVELARTAGVEVVDTLVQIRERFDAKYLLGKGRLEDVVLRAIDLDADLLVFDRNLSPAQALAIAEVSDLKVIDRSQLILDVFAQRAQGRDGKLQVELAQLKYSLPRLAQKDDALSRLSGGIGGRGPGETKLEVGRRRAKDRVAHLERELQQLAKQRVERRRRRARAEIPTVAIVGYTNAGKSTLLNAMTGADVLAEDKLFATLDTRSRVLRVGWAGHGGREVVVTDTVGFIRNLPKDLFAAFRATFEEAADADLLLHVVDGSDPAAEAQLDVTAELLEELGLGDIPRLLVFNKADATGTLDQRMLSRRYRDAIWVSAVERDTTRSLVEKIAEELAEKWVDAARPRETPIVEGISIAGTVDSEVAQKAIEAAQAAIEANFAGE